MIEVGFMTKPPLNKFLVNAKLHTYAGAGERAERRLPDGGKKCIVCGLRGGIGTIAIL